jgi:hypothetical protein
MSELGVLVIRLVHWNIFEFTNLGFCLRKDDRQVAYLGVVARREIKEILQKGRLF